MTAAQAQTETLTCGRCGSRWQRERRHGPKPRSCPDCRTLDLADQHGHPVGGGTRNTAPTGVDPSTAPYRVAAAAVSYRLAIEEATYLLQRRRPVEALAVLLAVPAPARATEGRPA